MAAKLTIALDAMGGDDAPDMVVKGIVLARERLPGAKFLLYGKEELVKPLVDAEPSILDAVEIRHTDQVVSNTDKPSAALRSGKQSSMRLAIDSVKTGDAAAAVSAGNTGALMAMAMFGLRTMPGIDRPAICTVVPTLRGETCMLDLGGNVECDADNLVQFAVMGEVFARTVMGLKRPTIGLLNVGVEELKGKDEVKLAAATLRNISLPIEFKGFVEGNDIGLGTVDVVVTDGFTGNIALKTVEGTSKLITTFLKEAFQSGVVAKLGYLLSRHAINKLRARADPRRYNGAVFLGLNGIAVKSHGGTDELGFANAIGVAADMATHGFVEKMRADMERINLDPS